MCRSATATTPARRCPSHFPEQRRLVRAAKRREARAGWVAGVTSDRPEVRAEAVSEGLSDAEWELLSRNRSPIVREQVALRTKSQAQLERLCRDRVEKVRAACLKNPALDPETLRLMSRDPSPAMRQKVYAAMQEAPTLHADLLALAPQARDARAVSLDTPITGLRAWEDAFDPYATVEAA